MKHTNTPQKLLLTPIDKASFKNKNRFASDHYGKYGVGFGNHFSTNDRNSKLVSHQGILIWFTGLSGSGKSSISCEVNNRLSKIGSESLVLDGDVLRRGINSDLGFSIEDRNEQVRRTGELAKMYVDTGAIVLVALISPIFKSREKVKSMFTNQEFMEVYCRSSLSECIRQDVKGLYQKAISGDIKDFTGISSPYEEPINPDLLLDTYNKTLKENVDSVISLLNTEKYLPNVKDLKIT